MDTLTERYRTRDFPGEGVLGVVRGSVAVGHQGGHEESISTESLDFEHLV